MIILILVILPQAVHGAEEIFKIPPQEVQAYKILDQIQDGKDIEYDHVIVNGNLDLSQLHLQRNITSSIRINESTFEGFVYFKDITFDKAIDFSSSNFSNLTDFGGDTFKDDAYFDGVTFRREANFGDAKFNRDANFKDTIFTEKANFRKTTFGETVSFWNATFNGYTNFGEATFSTDAEFSKDTFRDYAYFGGATFSGNANFEGETKFIEMANFGETVFKEMANFGEATFSKNADFWKAIFTEEANFRKATFNGDAFFDESIFKNDLDLTYTKYGKFYIQWSRINNLVYDSTAYQLLIENYKKLGFYDDADKCYYQFRVEQFLDRIDKNPVNDLSMSLFDLGAWIFYGFGKKPLYSVLWSIFFVVLFAFLWMNVGGSKDSESAIRIKTIIWILLFIAFFGATCLMDVVEPKILLTLLLGLSTIYIIVLWILWKIMKLNVSKGAINKQIIAQRWPQNLSEAFSFSATVFLSGTKLFVDPPDIPILQDMSASFMKKMFVIERLLGAFFSILFFLALTGMVTRPI
jgi:hypothetical protein